MSDKNSEPLAVLNNKSILLFFMGFCACVTLKGLARKEHAIFGLSSDGIKTLLWHPPKC